MSLRAKKSNPRDSFIAAFLAMTMALAVNSAGAAVPELSLPELIRQLHDRNPDLLAARKRLEAAQAKIPMAKGLPAPRIGVEWEEIPRGTVKLNAATVMYQLIQSLPFPGKLSLRHQVAVKDAQLAAAAFKKTEWETTGMLKSVYYDLFLVDRQMEIQQEQIVWLRQAAASALGRYSTGTVPQTELLRAQAEALQAATQLSVLEHRHHAFMAHLNHLLNRPADSSLGHPDALRLIPIPSDPERLLAQAKENQPELLAFKFSAERAEAAWRLSKRELLPDLETMLELRDPAMGPVGPWDLSLALVLPFWFWTKQQYGVKVALYDKESAEAAYQGALNEIARRIHENWHEAQAAYETAHLCQESLVPLAAQAVSSALAAYQGGRGSFMELVNALQASGERRRTYYEHLVALEQRMILLEQAVGIPLREEEK